MIQPFYAQLSNPGALTEELNNLEADFAFRWRGAFVEGEYYHLFVHNDAWARAASPSPPFALPQSSFQAWGYYAQAGYFIIPHKLELAIQGVAVDQKEHGVLTVALNTTRGQIDALYHPAEGEGGALVCVGGALGGYNGPAKKIYERLGRALSAQGISTLRVNYRQPGEFVESVQ